MIWFGNKEKSLDLKFEPYNTYISFRTCNYMLRYRGNTVSTTVTVGMSQVPSCAMSFISTSCTLPRSIELDNPEAILISEESVSY
jgi:hypothetical protein